MRVNLVYGMALLAMSSLYCKLSGQGIQPVSADSNFLHPILMTQLGGMCGGVTHFWVGIQSCLAFGKKRTFWVDHFRSEDSWKDFWEDIHVG